MLFILYIFIIGVASRLTFRQQMNIINVSGDLPGFMVRLTSFTSIDAEIGASKKKSYN